MRYLIAIIFIAYSSFNYAQITKIRVWESAFNNPTQIAMRYLHRALQLTIPEYGEYELSASVKMEQGRALLELTKQEKSKIDLAVFAPTKAREEQAIPIRIPLLKGLMGYRLCLINKNQQTLFNGIKNKHQLQAKEITIGVHQNWPDRTILQANHLSVKTSHKKSLLFQQLARKRFNCFSRGTTEIYAEYLIYRKQGIAIEDHLLLYYPMPLFFFVNKSRPHLAERLQLGLKRLKSSGELDTILNDYFLPILSELKLKQRTIIRLQNPTLSQQTTRAIQAPFQEFREKYLQR